MLDKNKLKPHKHHGRHGTCMECMQAYVRKGTFEIKPTIDKDIEHYKFVRGRIAENQEKKSARMALKKMNRLKDLGLTIGDVWMK